MWNCTACGEEVEDQFEACWNCEASRAGRSPLYGQEFKVEEDDHLKTLVNKKHKPINCLRCGQILKHTGTKRFHQGPSVGALGAWGELLVDRESLEMYVCPGCGHVEFFTFE